MCKCKVLPVLLCLIALTVTSIIDACTGIRISTTDEVYFRGRTMEFASFIPSDVIVIPRGWECTGTAVSGGSGLEWTSRYAVVGANGFGLPQVVDGVNEKGLSAAAFYFANYVEYQEEPDDKSSVLAPYELCTWLLTNFSTVDEVMESIDQVVVPPVVLDEFGFVPPLHFIVMDRSGDCIVLEHVEGELLIHDNPLGVITNSPTFDWHMTNLNNYVNISSVNSVPFELDGVEIRELGQGSGLLGIPGDFTPPSRFIRAVLFAVSAISADGSDEGVLQVFHILNQFDIPVGSCRRPADGSCTAIQCEYTLWSSVSDLGRCRYYFRTYDNSRIRMVDLMALDPNHDEILSFSMSGSEEILDLTGYPEVLSSE